MDQKQQEFINKYSGGRAFNTNTAGTSNRVTAEDVDRILSTSSSVLNRQSFFQDAAEDIRGIGAGIKESTDKRIDKISSIDDLRKNKKQGFIRSMLQKFGQGAGFVSDVVGETVVGGAKAIAPQGVEDVAKEAVTKVAETEPVQALMNFYSNLDEKSQRDIDAFLGVGALATDLVGGSLAKNVGKKVAKESVETGSRAISTGTKAIKEGTESLTDIPRRLVTNIEEGSRARQAIRELPNKEAQRAVRDGVDLGDVKDIISLPKENKAAFRQLFDAVKKVDSREAKIDIDEIVGKPIVTRVKELDKAKKEIGSKLGEVSKNLGIVTKPELQEAVLKRLKEVSSLNDISLNKNGGLNFKKTIFQSSMSKADKNAIQEAFTNATKWGDGRKAHLFRQELFEILGGKKKALSNITDTQEKAINAIRKGLSDVLETKNPLYKDLSNQYRKVIQPINELNKKLRATGLDEDLLTMKAGTLARRLTSNAASRADIKQILRDIDNAVQVKGKTLLKTESLQDFYNILDKYFDIANKTGFQQQVKSGIEKAANLQGVAIEKLSTLSGKTDSVRKKAIEDLLNKILR